MTKEEFVKWLNNIPPQDKDPFCPFNHFWFKHGYCNDAYSEKCYTCEFSQEWLKRGKE